MAKPSHEDSGMNPPVLGVPGNWTEPREIRQSRTACVFKKKASSLYFFLQSRKRDVIGINESLADDEPSSGSQNPPQLTQRGSYVWDFPERPDHVCSVEHAARIRQGQRVSLFRDDVRGDSTPAPPPTRL